MTRASRTSTFSPRSRGAGLKPTGPQGPPPSADEGRGALIRLTPGTVISRRISGHCSACWAISRSTAAISESRNSMWRMPGVDGLALLERQLQAGQPPAALDPEQVRARRLALQAALQHGVDLVLRARARVHELLAPGQPATQHAAAFIGHPHRLKLARPQQPRQRARVEPVGLRARLRDAGVVRADHDHPVDVRLKDPRDLPATARDLQRHPIRRHQAPAPATPAPRARSAPEHRNACSRPRRSQQRRTHGEHPGRSLDRPTSTPPTSHPHDAVDSERENQRDNDTDRYVLAAQSRQVAGAAERKARARSPSRKPAYPPAFSQQSPRPGSLDATAGPGQSLHGASSCREKRQPAPTRRLAHVCSFAIPRLRSCGPRLLPIVRLSNERVRQAVRQDCSFGKRRRLPLRSRSSSKGPVAISSIRAST